MLRNRDEGDVAAVEDLDELGKIRQRSGQPIDLINDDHVDQTCLDVCQHLLQGRSLHGAARIAAVVVTIRQHGPSLVLL